MDGKICCFTGHRPGKLMITEGQVRERLESAVAQAVCDGFTTYLSGMAKGTDLVAAEIVLRLRESDPRLKLVCAMPFEGFGQHWPDGWTERMGCVLENADSVHYVSKTYSPAVFQRRNQWLVDHSERVIAVFTGKRGGTKNTLAFKCFVRFILAQAVVSHGMELMTALFSVAQGAVTTIMDTSGLTAMSATTLPSEMVTIIEDVGFLESIPLWAVTLLGSLFIWVLSLVMILTVYSRFFKLYMATAIAPIPLSSFAGQPSSSIGVAFLKSYAAICLEGCVIVLACVIFSAFASAPPAVADNTLAAATIVWNYVGEVVFNMLVLVGAIKMSDRLIRELLGLG